MGEKHSIFDVLGQILPPTDPFRVLDLLRAAAGGGLSASGGGARDVAELAGRIAQARAIQNQSVAPQQSRGGAQPAQTSQSGSGAGGGFTNWLADKLYGRTPDPPPSPPPPGPPPMKGVNPVTGETLFSRNPKGEAGHERPGVGGAGNFGPNLRGPAGHRRPHQGEDISGPLGANIHAATDGRVTFSGLKGSETTGYGNLVVIDNGDGTITRYAHNRENLVHTGEKVRQGDVIATLGQTGNASELDPSEAHVHFEVEENGRRVDPATWLNSAIASSANRSSAPAAPAAQPTRPATRLPAPGKKR